MMLALTAWHAHSAYAQQVLPEGIDELARCIRNNMEGKQYATAGQTAYNFCQKELQVWRRACQTKYSPKGFDDIAVWKCDSQLNDFERQLDRQIESARPAPPNQANTRMDAALRDLKAGRSLPGLPDLKKLVYVTPNSLICRSPGALANPGTAGLLITGACIVFDRRIRVTVYPPRDSEEYIQNHLFNMVAVGWRSGDISDGNVFTGWVRIDGLEN